MWKILKEMGIPDPLYAGQEATVRTGQRHEHGTWNNRLVPNRKWSTSRLYIITRLFNLYAEYIMQNAGLVEAQAGIKIARKNTDNLRYADDTTIMAESEEE